MSSSLSPKLDTWDADRSLRTYASLTSFSQLADDWWAFSALDLAPRKLTFVHPQVTRLIANAM